MWYDRRQIKVSEAAWVGKAGEEVRRTHLGVWQVRGTVQGVSLGKDQEDYKVVF